MSASKSDHLKGTRSMKVYGRWVSAALGIAALVVAGGGYVMRAPPVEVVARPAKLQRMRAYVDERAMTRLPRRHILTMPYDGRLAEVQAREGDVVEAGQVVARLVPRDVELNLAAAKAVVERLQASLAENADIALELTAKRQTEILIDAMQAIADAALHQKEAAEAWEKYYASNAERVRRLTQSLAESQNELELAEANWRAGIAQRRQQDQNARSQQLMVAAMKLAPQMILDYLERKKLQGAVIEGQLTEAEVQREVAELQARRAVLTSPVAGVVLSPPPFSERFLRAGEEVLVIGALDELEVEADILTQEVTAIKEQDEVDIYGQALMREVGAGYPGHVRRVLPNAFTKVSSLGVEEQRTKVVVAFDDVAQVRRDLPSLGVGFRVRVRIFTAERERALVIPRSALFRADDGAWAVYVIEHARARIRKVKLGLTNDQDAEILDGLAENDLVIEAPASTLEDGTRVTF